MVSSRPVLYSVAYILNGLLLGVGFVVPKAWPLCVLGVFVFVYLVLCAPTTRLAVLGGILAWTVKSLLAVSWFMSAGPFPWLPAQAAQATVSVVALYTLYVALVLGFAGGMVAYGLKRYWAVFHPGIGVILFSFLWVGGEVLGSFLFSLGTYGPGGSLGISFSFGYLGYQLATHSLAYYSSVLGGVYILSLEAALVGAALFVAMRTMTKTRQIGWAVLGVFLVYATGGLTVLKGEVPKQGLTAAIIETEFSSEMMRDETWATYRSDRLNEAVAAALSYSPDYTVLPEDARLRPLVPSLTGAMDAFNLTYGDSDTVLIDSRALPISQHEKALRSYLYDSRGAQVYAVDKQVLVPAGEYVPYAVSTLLRVVAPTTATAYQEALTYRKGSLSSQVAFPAHLPAVLFCFESADPLAVYRLTKERSVPFVVHPISHALFTEPAALWQQQKAMLRVQARFGQVLIMSAANEATSGVYLPQGDVVVPEVVAAGEGWRVRLFRW